MNFSRFTEAVAVPKPKVSIWKYADVAVVTSSPELGNFSFPAYAKAHPNLSATSLKPVDKLRRGNQLDGKHRGEFK